MEWYIYGTKTKLILQMLKGAFQEQIPLSSCLMLQESF